MQNGDSKNRANVLSEADQFLLQTLSRRNFLMFSGGVAAAFCLGGFFSCGAVAGSGGEKASEPLDYPIDSTVVTTIERTLLFAAIEPGLKEPELPKISQNSVYGYGCVRPWAASCAASRSDGAG